MIKLLTSLNRITCDLVAAGSGGGKGGESGRGGSRYCFPNSLKWKTVAGLKNFFFPLLFNFSFFAADEKKRQEDEDDVMEGVGLVSLALAGWLAGSMKNEE